MTQTTRHLLTLAAELRAVGHTWDTIAQRVHRRPGTCQQWPARFREDWDQVYRDARRRRFEETSNEAHTHLNAMMRQGDDRIRLKAIEVWLKCGTAVYQPAEPTGGMVVPADQAEAYAEWQSLQEALAEYRGRLNRERAARGLPPLTDEEFDNEEPSNIDDPPSVWVSSNPLPAAATVLSAGLLVLVLAAGMGDHRAGPAGSADGRQVVLAALGERPAGRPAGGHDCTRHRAADADPLAVFDGSFHRLRYDTGGVVPHQACRPGDGRGPDSVAGRSFPLAPSRFTITVPPTASVGDSPLMSPRCLTLFLAGLVAPAAVAQFPLVAPTEPRTPADERKAFKLPPGFDAQLVVSEPDIYKPMQLAFDLKGRLWVPSSVEYPYAAVGRPGKDKLVVLSDIGPDGKAGKVTVFADELNIPIGILPLPDGKTVLVSSIDPGPEGAKEPAGCWIWKLTDTDGDGKADRREKLYGPFGTRDTHGMVNSFTLMPDGWVYACHGFANDSKVKGRDGHEVVMNSGHTFRFRPDGSRIEVYSRGQVNPFGMCHDTWFNLYTADCHSKPMTQVIRGAVYPSFGKPHDGLGFGPDMIRHGHGSTGLCGLAWYEADNFPPDYHGGLFLGNVVNSKINWDKVKFHGSTPEAIEQPDFLVSEDLWFRPVDIKLGPDGALYVSDFYNRIIGHYEVPLTHPGRDRTRGRVWRVVYRGPDGTGAPPKGPTDLTRLKDKELDALLGHPNITLRMQATHALINPPEDRKVEERELRKQDEAEGLGVYDAHRLWADEAEPIERRRERPDRQRIAQDETPFLRAHYLRVQTAHAEWEADRRRRGQEDMEKQQDVYKVDGVGHVGRAEAEGMAAVPKAENLPTILARLDAVPAADTHLRHALRIALRETLRDPAAWTRLKGEKLIDGRLRLLADVVTGLPTPAAAEFLTANLSTLASDPARLPAYVEHAARYGDGHRAVFAFVSKHRPDDVRLTSALFQGYQRGLQQKGGPRFDQADIEFAEGLVIRGLADADGGTVQRCLDVAGAMKLKASTDAIVGLAARRDRDENQRAAAFVTLLGLDQDRGVKEIGKVLASPDEAITAREKAAQALGLLGTPAAHAELLAVLEKAPARMQTVIASALAGRSAGAELLLRAVETGKASARLLQDRTVQTRLNESKLPRAAERVAELTRGLPSVDDRMADLMVRRRAGFGAAKPDPVLGAGVFKTNCANCHQVGGEGAKVGPQLDGIGVRGLDRLLEDMLDPSRNVDQAFRSTTLNLKDGRSVSGLILREEGELIVLADAMGKELRIPKGDVEERRPSILSPMPANLVDTIKEADFYHLMAYLLQQRTKEK